MNNVVAIKQEEAAERIEFGGLMWTRTTNDHLVTHIAGQGEAWVFQYTEGYNKGRWFWHASISDALGDTKLSVADSNISGIEDTLVVAMTACLSALDDYLNDMRRILLKLSPGDDYARGYADGKAALAAALSVEISAALEAA